MKRKLFYGFVFFICLYLIIIGIFGKNGFLYNRSLKNVLSILNNQLESIENDIEDINKRIDELKTEEGIRDAAIKVGYYVEGDRVYVFENADVQSSLKTEEAVYSYELYKPLKNIYCLGISLILAFAMTFFVSNKNKDNYDTREEQSKDSDDFDFINA